MSEFRSYGSPYNWESEFFKKSNKKDKIIIDDLTLEGDCEEMAGVAISEKDKIEIATRLSDLGVPRMSVLGYSPMPSPVDVVTAKKIADLGLPIKLGSFAKTQEEIEVAAQIGLWGVTILVGVGDTQQRIAGSLADVIEKSERLTSFAKDHGLYTISMGMNSTRASLDSLREVIRSVESNCDELCVADSRGVISPWGYRYLIEQVATMTKLPLSVHIHNHTSMAVANALACVLGGVSVLQTTVNGMGELSGLLPLEEIAIALPIQLDVSTGIKLEGLKDLSDMVARATGVATSIHKPAVGEYTFSIPETEAIQQGAFKRFEMGITGNMMAPYPPNIVGNKSRLAIGRKCNEYTIRYNIGINGYTASPDTIKEIVAAVRNKASQARGFYLMENDELMRMIKEGGYKLIPIKNNELKNN